MFYLQDHNAQKALPYIDTVVSHLQTFIHRYTAYYDVISISQPLVSSLNICWILL